MNDHIEGPLLTAYTDGMVTLEDSLRIQTHIASCANCRESMHEMRNMKQRVAALPLHTAPSDLVANLKKTYMAQSLWERLTASSFFSVGWKPVSAFAAAAFLAAGVWFYTNH